MSPSAPCNAHIAIVHHAMPTLPAAADLATRGELATLLATAKQTAPVISATSDASLID